MERGLLDREISSPMSLLCRNLLTAFTRFLNYNSFIDTVPNRFFFFTKKLVVGNSTVSKLYIAS